jgi:transcriptional regulator with PAS, ATPase and Fis domain
MENSIISLVWPDISFLEKISEDKKLALEIAQSENILIESGRSRICKNLVLLNNKYDQLTMVKILVPFIYESEKDEIADLIHGLTAKKQDLKIEWYYVEESKEVEGLKKKFSSDQSRIFFIKIKDPVQSKKKDLDYVRYFMTRAFLGKNDSGEFDTEYLRKVINWLSGENYYMEYEKNVKAFKNYDTPVLEGFSKPMLDLKKRIHQLSRTDLNVLIKGETGSGKDGAAFFIHDLSNRNKKNFGAVNCALFEENYLISELFGHKKGSFTGALSDKKGIFESLSGGTLFLDQIHEMPERCQMMVLRFLEKGEFSPIGTKITRLGNVRIIAAGSKALIKEKLRPEFFFRISEVKIEIPPLKDITEDIITFVDHYIYKKSNDPKKRYEVKKFFEDNMDLFKNYEWPGNIRELLAFVKRRFEIGQGEEKFILDDIGSNSDADMFLNDFETDFSVLVKKHKNKLPSKIELESFYAKSVTEVLSSKTRKHIAENVLKITQNTYRSLLEKD